MAGSVPEAAGLVVTDPVQAGVVAVADTARLNVVRLAWTTGGSATGEACSLMDSRLPEGGLRWSGESLWLTRH